MKHFMHRKISFFALSLLLIFNLSFPVFAADSDTYYIDELNMDIDVPSDYIVFTRDISSNDPNLSRYGLNRDDVVSMLETNNIYLNAGSLDGEFEIVVTMVPNMMSSFNLLGDTGLLAITTAVLPELEEAGANVTDYETYQSSQAKFVKMHVNHEGTNETVYSIQYYTVQNNQSINITLHSYTGKNTTLQENVVKAMVDSVHFESIASLEFEESDPFVFEDSETGVMFTVPANWVETNLSKEREVLENKFVSNEDPGASIMYGSVDLWEQLTASEKKGFTRSDVDNSIMSESDIIEMFGGQIDSVSKITYSGKEYYMTESASVIDIADVELTMPLIQLIRIENAYAYVFEFGGYKQSNSYEDFELLMESVQCFTTDTTEEISTESATDVEGDGNNEAVKQKSSSNDISYIFLILIVLLLVVFIILFVLRKKRNLSLKENSTQNSNYKYCIYCGARIPCEAQFCSSCGGEQDILK